MTCIIYNFFRQNQITILQYLVLNGTLQFYDNLDNDDTSKTDHFTIAREATNSDFYLAINIK